MAKFGNSPLVSYKLGGGGMEISKYWIMGPGGWKNLSINGWVRHNA